jgi:hypothetical protein
MPITAPMDELLDERLGHTLVGPAAVPHQGAD